MTMATVTAALQDGNAKSSFVEILVELANSVAYQQSPKCRRGDHGVLPVEPSLLKCAITAATTTTTTTFNGSTTNRCAVTPRCHDPLKMRRKRRRDVLNVFFDSASIAASSALSSSSSSSSSPNTIRKHTYQLFKTAKENFGKVSETHAAMLQLLCGLVVPGIEGGEHFSDRECVPELSVAEQMLYVILRTSTAAVPTWVRPQIMPRCWLSPAITAVVERSAAVQRTMRWSCDPDPVIAAALGVNAAGCNLSSIWSLAPCHIPPLVPYYTNNVHVSAVNSACDLQSSWCTDESEDVQHLFTGKCAHDVALGKEERESSPLVEPREVSAARVSSSPDIMIAWPLYSVFREEYPSKSPFCSLLFVALHRGIVGQQDPYLLLQRLDCGEDVSSTLESRLSLGRPSLRSQGFAALHPESLSSGVRIDISPEFLVAMDDSGTEVEEEHEHERGEDESEEKAGKKGANKRKRRSSVCEKEERKTSGLQCSRGVMAMLQWSCHSGTLFLRLHHLCEVSERPEWRAALGQYGKSAIEALRRLLFVLQRLVAEMADRPGGPHGVSFDELLSAQRRLRPVAEDITALSDAFRVHAGAGWEAAAALRELSSATLLSSLYRHYAQLTVNNQGRHAHADSANTLLLHPDPTTKRDVIGDVFLAALRPLHQMMGLWLRKGELLDPYDEFFIVPSHGRNACGFLVDTSVQRLPEFISTEAAEEILHGGVSLRVFRASARHVGVCTKKEQKRLETQTEDVDTAAVLQKQAEDVTGVNRLLHNFVESLLGRRSPSHFLPVPEVDLLLKEGALSYWQTFYEACNGVLLSVCEEINSGSDGGKGSESVNLPASPMHPGEEEEEEEQDLFKGNSAIERGRGGGGGRGVAKSLTSSISCLSKATTVWHEAVSAELAQVAWAGCQDEADKTKARAALCSEYERQVVRRKAQRQLRQWKAQRLSLKLERSATISRSVDDLLELYASVLNPRGTNDERTNEGDGGGEDGHNRSQTPIGKFVKPLPAPPCRGECVAVRTTNVPSFGVTAFKESENQPRTRSKSSPCRPFLPISLRRCSYSSGSKCTTMTRVLTPPTGVGVTAVAGMASSSNSLLSLPKGSTVEHVQPEPRELAHPPEMYVVADINDDECVKGLADPHVNHTDATEALYAQLAALEEAVQKCDVSSEVYQRECTAVALETLSVARGKAASSAGGGKCISALWWTDPTADEGDILGFKCISSSSSSNTVTALSLTEQQAKTLLHCSYYYLTLGRHAASYLTHKALQVMFLGPYGTLHRLTRQLLDVCLMQNGHTADRLTESWQRLTREAIEENRFDASTVVATLNRVFVEEWESCVLHGRDTLEVRLAISLPKNDHSNENGDEDDDDGNGVKNKLHPTVNENDGSCASGAWFHHTSFRRRTRHATSWHLVEGVEAEEEEEEEEKEEVRGTRLGLDASAAPMPDNPFDFLARLTVVYDMPCGGFWVLPDHAISVYSDLFSTLLFWTSVKQLVTRVWQIGIRSGVREAFFFCSVTRTVLHAVMQHIWFLISGYSREYSNMLRFESGVFYAYQQLENFTADHAVFLERCRFAAMLTPAFACVRQQVYGMVRQLEEVEQSLLCAEREDAADEAEVQAFASDTPAEATTLDEQLKRVHAQEVVRQKGQESKEETCGSKGPRRGRAIPSSGHLFSSHGGISSTALKRNVQPSADSCGQLQLDVSRRMDVRRRAVRETIRRRLRSFAGLTEIFLGHLTEILDSTAVDAEATLPQESTPKRRFSACDTLRISESTAALKSLIRAIEMMQSAIHGRL